MGLIALLALLVHLCVQKFFAIRRGYTIKYKMWIVGLLVGVYFCFISNGSWIFFLPGGIIFTAIAHKRLKYKQPAYMQKDAAFVSFFGPLSNILLAFIFHFYTSFSIKTSIYHVMRTLPTIAGTVPYLVLVLDQYIHIARDRWQTFEEGRPEVARHGIAGCLAPIH